MGVLVALLAHGFQEDLSPGVIPSVTHSQSSSSVSFLREIVDGINCVSYCKHTIICISYNMYNDVHTLCDRPGRYVMLGSQTIA